MTKKKVKPDFRVSGNDKDKTAELAVRDIVIGKLNPHPRNPRVHAKRGSGTWNALRKSLEAGLISPLVWNERNGFLVSGHFRLKVMKDMGFLQVPCVVVDWVERKHLARMIAANKQQGADDAPSVRDVLNAVVEADKLEFTALDHKDLVRGLGLDEKVDTSAKLEKPVFQVIVKFDNEKDSEKFIREMEKEGRSCKRIMQ